MSREDKAERIVMDLDPLIARVEAATGPDRELDAEVWRVLLPDSYRLYTSRSSGLRPRGADAETWTREWAASAAERFTGSIDRAIALVELARPGWDQELKRLDGVWSYGLGDPLRYWDGENKHAPLAILAALLKAIQAQR